MDFLKKRFLVLVLILSVTFSLAPTRVAHASFLGDLFTGISAGIIDSLSFGTLSISAVMSAVSTGTISNMICQTGGITLLCNSDSGVTPTLTSQTAGGSSCQLAITSTFYIPSFNYGNGNPSGAVIDETHNKIALYRFSWPISKFQDSLGNFNSNMFGMWTLSTPTVYPNGVTVGYGVGGAFGNQVGTGWASNIMNINAGDYDAGGYFEGNGVTTNSDSPLAVMDYSQVCKGNVCTIPDSNNVPQNSYVFYVAKILGDYAGMEIVGGGGDAMSGNYSPPTAIYPVKPNKFLSKESLGNGVLATLPELWKDAYSIGNVYAGPYKTGVPVCPVSITTSSLSGGTFGTSYSASIEGTGGSDSYDWSAVGLPAGLSISNATCVASPCKAPGTISGTPTASGTYGVVVQLQSGDPKSGGQTVSKQFSLVISSAIPPTVNLVQSLTTTTSDGTTGQPFTLDWGSSNATSCSMSKTVNGGSPRMVSCYATSTAPYSDATHLNHSCQPAPVPIGTHVFTFSCTGPSGTTSKSVTHTVSSTTTSTVPQPGTTTAPTATISQSGVATTPLDPVKITWSSTNATSCTVTKTVNGGASLLPFSWTSQPTPNTSGSAMATPSVLGTHRFSINCTGPGGTASSSVTHTVTGCTIGSTACSAFCSNGATNSPACTFSCNRCSTVYNYTRATFDSNASSCSTSASNTNVVYACDPSCGRVAGNYAYGNCASSTSTCSQNAGSSCASAANTCGERGTGTIQCNGSCSAVVPPPGLNCSPAVPTI